MSHHRCCCGAPGVACAAPLGYTTGNLYGCSDAATTRIGNIIVSVDAQTVTRNTFRTWVERWRVLGSAEFALSTSGTAPNIRVVGTFVTGELRAELEVTISGYGNQDGYMNVVRTMTPAQVFAHVTSLPAGRYGIDGIGGGTWGFGKGTDDPYFAGYTQSLLTVASITPRIDAVGSSLMQWATQTPIQYTSSDGTYSVFYSSTNGRVALPPGVTACAPQGGTYHQITGYNKGSFSWANLSYTAFPGGVEKIHTLNGSQAISWASCTPAALIVPPTDQAIETYLNQDPLRRCRGCGQ